jgi:hypothetical protein
MVGAPSSLQQQQQPQQQRSDGGLQYDSSSFPLLSSTSSGGRFAGLPNQPQLREEDFVIQNEDFPALPGSNPGAKNDLGLGGLSGLGLSLTSQDRLDVSSQLQLSGSSLGGALGQQRQGDSLSGLGSGLLASLSGGGQSPLLSGQSGQQAPPRTDAVSKDSRYGLAGLLDVIRMTDRVRTGVKLVY